MRRIVSRIYKPSEKLPMESTAMEQHVVLIKYRHTPRKWFKNEPWSWDRGILLNLFSKCAWRIVGTNNEVEVAEWMELPKLQGKHT